MAETEVAVDNEFVVYESKDATLPANGAEPEAPVGPEEEAPDVVADKEAILDAPDHKRKLEDLEPSENDEAPTKKQVCADPLSEHRSPSDEETKAASEATKDIEVEAGGSGHQATEEPVSVSDAAALDAAALDAAASDIAASYVLPVNSVGDGNANEEKLGYGGDVDMSGLGQLKSGAELVGNGEIASTENIQHTSVDDKQNSPPMGHQGSLPFLGQQASDVITSCKVEVPNNKVGVVIGKSGDTIRYLQANSGAKIQITKDANTDPNSSTRLVELVGSLESISKAAQLIKDVLAESEAGGSPSLVARGFITAGGEQIEIQIPNEKVGVIIGKGGESIKSLQRKSGARIQLLPQHLPDGDSSKGQTVRIVGNKKQIESARELIKDVLNQSSFRPSPLSGAHNQHPFRGPRGPPPATQWAPRGPSPHYQPSSYDHHPRGMYPPQPTQYPQSYGGYSSQQQLPPKGWDQHKPAVTPSQMAPPSGGYDYYNQAGPAPNPHPSNPSAGPIPASSPAPINYNYGQSQAPDGYGHPAPYAQPPPSQQNYGQVYSEPKYDTQPTPHAYSQQPVGPQSGMYPQQSAAPYGKPAYSAPQEAPPNYNQPRPLQPADPMYQGPPPNQYSQTTLTQQQQQYPYATSVPTQQQAPPYGQAYGPTSAPPDIYAQQPTTGYPPHGYGGQPVPVYAQQAPQAGGYSQYPSSQASYVDQTAPANANYGYQGGASDTGYVGNVPAASYAGPPPVAGQPVYSQPPANTSGYYEQSAQPQSGYAGAQTVPAAPSGYANSGVVAQPGYSGQYDASQMYGHH